MWMLPNLETLKGQYSYTNLFTLTLAWNIGLFGMFFLVMFTILFAIKIYLAKVQVAKQEVKASLITSQQASHQQNEESSSPKFSKGHQQKWISNTISFLASLFFYLTWISIAILYLCFYSFGFFGHSTGQDILAVIVMFSIVAIPTLVWQIKIRRTRECILRQTKKQIIVTVSVLALWLGISIFSTLSSKGMCICDANDNYGVRIHSDFAFSTQWMRQQHIKPVCPDGQVCHLYATLPEQTSTSVFINVHSGTNLTDLKMVMKDPSGKIIQKISSKPFALTKVDYIGQRNIHSVLFKGLNPATLYQITIVDPLSNKTLRVSNYKTLPGKDAEQLRLAVGGDVGMTVNGSKLTSYLKGYKPDVLLIGGDITYDDAMRTCWYSWDNFYWIFEQLEFSLNRTIPMILTIGNHDVGYDALSFLKTYTDLDNIPLFMLYNPQHSSKEDSQEVPLYSERKSIHYHLIGNTLHLMLDSGYLKSHEDQVYFIRALAKQYEGYYKFSNYHNPIYPSCTDHTPNSNDIQCIGNGTKYWVPLFDEFRFVGAMEHHTHHRKLTKKLKNGTYNSTGVRYIGDGSWGVRPLACNSQRITLTPERFEDFDTANPSHIWQVTLIRKELSQLINYTSIDLEGSNVFELMQVLPPLRLNQEYVF